VSVFGVRDGVGLKDTCGESDDVEMNLNLEKMKYNTNAQNSESYKYTESKINLDVNYK